MPERVSERSKSGRRLSLTVIFFAAAALLSGCDNFGDAPIALRMSPNHTVLVMMCDPTDVVHVTISLRSRDQVVRDVELTPREPISLGPSGQLDLSDPKFLLPGMPSIEGVEELGIVIDAPAGTSGSYQITSFTISPDGIPSREWLRPDGTTDPDPCPGRPKEYALTLQPTLRGRDQ